MLIVSEAWKTAYPGAAMGILVMRGVANPDRHPALDRYKRGLESQLRSRFANCSRAALAALPPIQAYNAYFGRYEKTYHVLLQLESVALKGKSIPHVAALVEARRMILEAASSLPPEKRDEIFLGTWSVRDLLAHLAGWDFTNLQAAQEILTGRLPAFYARYDHDGVLIIGLTCRDICCTLQAKGMLLREEFRQALNVS